MVAAWVTRSIRSEIILGSKVLMELGMEATTEHQPAVGSPPPEVPGAAPAGHYMTHRPWEAWCDRQRQQEASNGRPVTDEEGQRPRRQVTGIALAEDRGCSTMVGPCIRKYGTGAAITIHLCLVSDGARTWRKSR